MITYSNQLELRHIKYFLAVAECLHFRNAADKLFISQPGLSRQIKQMEDDLGILLFERNNRKVNLTKAGEYLKKEFTHNLKHLEDIIGHAKLLHDGVEGNLKLGYVGSAMQKIIPNLLLRTKNERPNIRFNLSEMDNQKQIESLLSNEIDLGFVRLERVPKGLNIRPLLIEPFSLVLPEDHRLSSSSFESIKQLKNESFILFDESYSPAYFERVMNIFDDAGFSPVISHNTIHAASIYRLVENGFGISIVPKSLKPVHDSSIKFIDLDSIPQKTTLSAVWNPDNRNPVLGSFINLLEKT